MFKGHDISLGKATNLNELVDLVNDEIKKGWQPLGGITIMPIAVTGNAKQHGFFQPMFK